jgi:hypothetical protein
MICRPLKKLNVPRKEEEDDDDFIIFLTQSKNCGSFRFCSEVGISKNIL